MPAPFPSVVPAARQRKLADYLIDDLFPSAPGTTRDAPATGAARDLTHDLAAAGALMRHGTAALSRLHVQIRLGRAIEIFRLDPLVEAVIASARCDPHALIAAAQTKTAPAASRPVAVAALMACFADRLDLSRRERREAVLAGLLHDVGMLAVPAAVLGKRTPLRREELAAIRDHVGLGEAYLASSFGLPPAVLVACRQHHERIDGAGYPDGIAAPEISRLSRMLAICDSYDAIISPRAHRRALLPARAPREMRRDGGLDPVLLDTFMECVGPYPLGSLVQLGSGKLGAVTGFCGGSVRHPTVTVFQCAVSGRRLEPAEIACTLVAGERAAETIASAEDPERWRFADWQDRWPALATEMKARSGGVAPRAVA